MFLQELSAVLCFATVEPTHENAPSPGVLIMQMGSPGRGLVERAGRSASVGEETVPQDDLLRECAQDHPADRIVLDLTEAADGPCQGEPPKRHDGRPTPGIVAPRERAVGVLRLDPVPEEFGSELAHAQRTVELAPCSGLAKPGPEFAYRVGGVSVTLPAPPPDIGNELLGAVPIVHLPSFAPVGDRKGQGEAIAPVNL